MKLQESPFERIKNGTKTIEFRLYDEKRSKIKIGDQIEFSKLPDLQETILVDVLDLYRDSTFENLFKKLFTDEDEIKKKTTSMYQYYSPDEEKQYGVVGIKISLISSGFRYTYNKLVRDKVLKILKDHGYRYECDKYVGRREFRRAIANKLEEDLKFLLDTGIHDNQLDRLVDMIDLLYAYARDCDITKSMLEKARNEKEREKGSYRERIKLISVDDGKDIDEV